MPSTSHLTGALPADPPVAGDSVDLADSDDPRLLIPGDPAELRAAARALSDNAGLHGAIAGRQRHLHDGGWTGTAADAFHTHLTRQATRHTGAADATQAAADALTELADGIEQARTYAGRAAALHTDSDTSPRDNPRADPALREQEARDLLDDTRAQLADVHARVRVRLAAARTQLPDPHRLLHDPDPAAIAPTALPALPALSALPTLPAAGLMAGRAADPAPDPAGGTVAATVGTAGGTSTAAAELSTVTRWADRRAVARQVVVRHGDTLYAIAARYLGDASRWPEIFDDNPAIADPWDIRPGQTLTLPETPPDGGATHHPTTPDHPPTHDSDDSDDSDDDSDSGADCVGLDDGLFISGGLAAALSTAYLKRQRRRHRSYRPDTPADRDDPPTRPRRPKVWTPDEVEASIQEALDPDYTRVAHPAPDPYREPRTPPAATEPPAPPVVRQLHLAYHRKPRPADHTDLTGTTAAQPDGSRADTMRRPRLHLSVPLGVTAGGASVPLDLTATPALALTAAHTPDTLATPAAAGTAAGGAAGASMIRTGDRAGDVARAMLLTIAAGLRTLTGDPLGHVVITTADLRHLLGLTDLTTHTVALPSTIRVVDDLDAALDELDIALARRAPFPDPHDPVEAAVVLIATAPRPGTPITRMQHLLTAGHPHGVCAVLLGDWPTPTRITVAPDGTAARVTGQLPPALIGARLFTVPRHDALDLLTTLARPTDPQHTLRNAHPEDTGC